MPDDHAMTRRTLMRAGALSLPLAAAPAFAPPARADVALQEVDRDTAGFRMFADWGASTFAVNQISLSGAKVWFTLQPDFVDEVASYFGYQIEVRVWMSINYVTMVTKPTGWNLQTFPRVEWGDPADMGRTTGASVIRLWTKDRVLPGQQVNVTTRGLPAFRSAWNYRLELTFGVGCLYAHSAVSSTGFGRFLDNWGIDQRDPWIIPLLTVAGY